MPQWKTSALCAYGAALMRLSGSLIFLKDMKLVKKMGWESLERPEEDSRNGYVQLHCIHVGNFQRIKKCFPIPPIFLQISQLHKNPFTYVPYFITPSSANVHLVCSTSCYCDKNSHKDGCANASVV